MPPLSLLKMPAFSTFGMKRKEVQAEWYEKEGGASRTNLN